jgi:hypothetical protein
MSEDFILGSLIRVLTAQEGVDVVFLTLAEVLLVLK